MSCDSEDYPCFPTPDFSVNKYMPNSETVTESDHRCYVAYVIGDCPSSFVHVPYS